MSSGRDFDDRASVWAKSDAWMTFLRERLPRAITFLYMPDEPRPPSYPRILALAENIHSNLALAENIHSNPGPGRWDSFRHRATRASVLSAGCRLCKLSVSSMLPQDRYDRRMLAPFSPHERRSPRLGLRLDRIGSSRQQ